MKKKQYITYILFFISLIMPMIPVIPHHHHADGTICMKNDIGDDNGCGHRRHADDRHCCCDTGCMATHFVQQIPDSSDDVCPHPDIPWTVIIYFTPLSKLLTPPESNVSRQEYAYQKSLYSTFTIRAAGLRAPPSLIA